MKNTGLYVDVILPLPVAGMFTYSIDNNVDVGQRVVVQFGIRKIYTAIVAKLHNDRPTNNYRIKQVIAIIDEPPVINSRQLKLWYWISNYYMCNIGEVMNAALPSSLKLASETKITFHEDFDANIDGLNKDEIVTRAKEIGTYEISIKPYEDCCSYFVPIHPETKAKINRINIIEKKLDIKNEILMALENTEKIKINFLEE